MTADQRSVRAYDYDRLMNMAFVGLAFTIPVSKALTSLLTAILILLWFVQGNIKEKVGIILHNKLSLAILLLIALSFVSLFWSSNTIDGIKFIFVKYWFFLPVFIMLTAFRISYTRYVLDAFLASMLISEVVSYGIYFGVWNVPGSSRMFPTAFMDHVSYSVYLVFAIAVLALKICEQKNIWSKIFMGTFFVTATANLFVNGGRTGQFAFILIAVVMAVYYYRNSYKLLLSAFVVITLFALVAYKLSPNFQGRMKQLYTDIHNVYAKHNYSGSMGGRFSMWVIGVNRFIEHPILGSGIGNEKENAVSYAKKYGFDEQVVAKLADYHNNFIQYAVELGIGGLLITLFILYKTFTFHIEEKRYKILSIVFAIVIFSDEMGGFTFHLMDPLVLFVVFSSLFNAIEYNELTGRRMAVGCEGDSAVRKGIN